MTGLAASLRIRARITPALRPALRGVLGPVDQAVILRLPVLSEVEDVVLDLAAAVEVGLGHDRFVAKRTGKRHDLAGERDELGR